MAATNSADPLAAQMAGRWLTTPVILRTASIVSVLCAAGHTLGGFQAWSPAGETDVLRAMRSFRFDAQGVTRTYWEFYIGFGVMISVFLLVQAVLLWQLAAMSRKDPVHVRPLLGTLLMCVAANAGLSWYFFFAAPVVFGIVIATTLAAALALPSGQAVRR